VAVSFVSNDYGGESTIKEDQNFNEDIFYNNEGELSKPVTVTVYVMVVLLAVGIAFIVDRIRIGHRRRRSQNVDTQFFETSNTDGDEEKIALSDASAKQSDTTAKHMNVSVPKKSYGKVKSYTQGSVLNQINNNDSKSDMDSSIKPDSSNVKRLDPPSQIQESV
jgi:hypothetical protein